MKKWFPLFLCLVLLVGTLIRCAPRQIPTTTPTKPRPASPTTPFVLTSSAFEPGQAIPRPYTCDGKDISPPLQWRDPPPGTMSFALIMDDPDARGWVHWLLYNLPVTTHSLPEAVPAGAELPDGSRQGKNSWGKAQYGGPCPPSGTHRYSFRLYALDIVLDIPAGANVAALQQAMEGHILDQAELIGVYRRQ
ncbi:MAG: YbhB/YbcL family Raf kinase inhibitor-like protein [Chloroflexi bacterium]|nr:YbhB/YbcL family Raf kinase inhibitor-like protein [Chloroflexota bacterium]